MSVKKKHLKLKQIRGDLMKELSYLRNVFSVLNVPTQTRDDDDLDFEIVNGEKADDKELPKRARNITELEEKLQKLKTENNFSFKKKLVKKSLTSKLSKKIKKRERLNKSKANAHVKTESGNQNQRIKTEVDEKKKMNVAKPVFNTDGKLVFSKFDFANVGHKDKVQKVEKDPKKILINLKEQEQKIKNLEGSGDDKAKELKEKIAWKNVLQKAEGQKVKDDPTLLKKSIKKLEQKKKQSKKKWDNRIQSVEQKKDERQKKRKENIGKKKKEKKSKIVKAAVKRGRVVI